MHHCRCGVEYCFICLKTAPKGVWPPGHTGTDAYAACPDGVAPRQTSIPGQGSVSQKLMAVAPAPAPPPLPPRKPRLSQTASVPQPPMAVAVPGNIPAVKVVTVPEANHAQSAPSKIGEIADPKGMLCARFVVLFESI